MAPRLKMVRILWFALVLSNVMLYVMMHVAQGGGNVPPDFAILAGAISFSLAIASIVLPARGFAMAHALERAKNAKIMA